MSSSHNPAMAGLRSLGRYDFLRRLAIGGMGEVFLARERSVAGVDRLVVIKLMLDELAERPEQVALFIDEARIAMQLAHPNIVQVYDFGEENGAYYMAMEYVPGQNLARLCERASRKSGSYPRHSAIHVVAEMARGLDFAHKAKDSHGRPMEIVHRDISPHNTLVSTLGDVKLLDFGIAHANIREQRTETGVLRGKFGYMSPEQLAQAELDARSDVFCAGIVLWETTLMKRLFRGETEMETLQLVARCEVPMPRSIDPTYPEDLEAAVMTALAHDPNERFQSAGAMAAALRNVLKRKPRVEKDELGTLVTTLFPETLPNDVAEVIRITAPMTAANVHTRTAAVADVATGADTVAKTGATRVREVSASEEPATAPVAPAPEEATSETPSTGRGWIPLTIAGVAVVAVGSIILASSGGSKDTAAGAADTTDAGAQTDAVAVSGDVDHDASTPIAVANYDAAVAVAKRRSPPRRPERRKRRPDRNRAIVDASVPRIVQRKPPVDARPKPIVILKTPKGRLAITASPYGRVTINGKNYGATDLVQKLPVGTYRVVVKMSDGSGTHTATTRVETNKKTKCQVSAKRLRCQSPR